MTPSTLGSKPCSWWNLLVFSKSWTSSPVHRAGFFIGVGISICFLALKVLPRQLTTHKASRLQIKPLKQPTNWPPSPEASSTQGSSGAERATTGSCGHCRGLLKVKEPLLSYSRQRHCSANGSLCPRLSSAESRRPVLCC